MFCTQGEKGIKMLQMLASDIVDGLSQESNWLLIYNDTCSMCPVVVHVSNHDLSVQHAV